MEQADFRDFTALLLRWAELYYPYQVAKLDWTTMPHGYFEDLQVLTLEEVHAALRYARKHSKFWPTVAELCEYGHVYEKEARQKIRLSQAQSRTALPFQCDDTQQRPEAVAARELAALHDAFAVLRRLPGWADFHANDDPTLH